MLCRDFFLIFDFLLIKIELERSNNFPVEFFGTIESVMSEQLETIYKYGENSCFYLFNKVRGKERNEERI